MNENQKTTHQTPKMECPVDGYVRDLLADITHEQKYPWTRTLPEDAKGKAVYSLSDADGKTVTLTCDSDKPSHCQYTLRVMDENANPVMRSIEWASRNGKSDLRTLYTLLERKFEYEEEEAEALSDETIAEQYREAKHIDCFLQALIKDAKSKMPRLKWTTEYHDEKVRYYSSGLQKQGSSIWLQQDHVDDESDAYSFRYVRDGKEIMSCTESSLLSSPVSQLRQLFIAISKRDTEQNDGIPATPEVHRFIADTQMRQVLDRICATQTKGPILVGDLFRQATFPCVTHQFVLAAIDRAPGLRTNTLEKLRLQRLAEHTIGVLQSCKRSPNGATFSTKWAINVAFDAPGVVSRTAKMTSSLQSISNAYTDWPAEIFADADISHQAKVNRTCVLLLMGILKDELP